MNSLLVVFVTFIVAVSCESLGSDADWEAYKTKYEKKYSADEEMYRRKIWESNLKKIEAHNARKSSFKLGMNHLGDLTNIEYQALMMGTKYRPERRNGSTFLPHSNVAVPNTVDWRTKGYVTGVKNQENCGSCWAFSATGSLEGQHFKKTGNLVSLSEQNLVDCSQSYGNHGCEGGLMDYAFDYIKANGGIDTEASYPYKAMDERCKFRQSNVGATCSGHTDIQKGSEEDLHSAVGTVGPISVAIDASNSSFQFYQSGVYDNPACSSTKLDHGVLAVGYGTYQGKEYWLVKNSWGTNWGLKGYIMMSRNKNNQCGIATSASYPLV